MLHTHYANFLFHCINYLYWIEICHCEGHLRIMNSLSCLQNQFEIN